MDVRAGTSGYSYKAWVGAFYPTGLPASEMLRHYAARFRTVEINNTFYRMPKASLLEGWAAQVPEDFQFALKAPQRITHQRRLQDVAEPVEQLVQTASVLRHRLGPILFQLPPFLKKDLPRLRDLLAMIPAGTRAAVEFRNVSWFDDETYSVLRERDAALCIADTGDKGDPPFVATAGWGYLRLRRENYDEGDLARWSALVRALPWSTAFVFFKHEDEAIGPKLAARFSELRAP